ncbi:hypothetical protein ACFQRK_23615 [Parapedobacter sp. GCM10030251]|uniref:hypothetical protein n=1 Tax=Parapedobacter sp. GCM10030251 TaxID=3273419 RepID=UPI00360F712E
MNEFIKEIITVSTLESYASGCVKIYDTLSKLKDIGYKKLIIPSRGAYPFYYGAQTVSVITGSRWGESFEFTTHFKKWLLPFTSDWGGHSNPDFSSRKSRMFWAKILADVINGEETIHLRYFRALVSTFGNLLTVNTGDVYPPANFSKNVSGDDKFIFIDTAISGRAIHEIITAFRDLGLTNYFIILVVDNNGNLLEGEYKNTIHTEKGQGRLVDIPVEKIFSEDASPLLNRGISALVFPSIIQGAYAEIPDFHRDEMVGAGIWFIDSLSHLRHTDPERNGIMGALGTLLYAAINAYLDGESEFHSHMVDFDTSNMIDRAGKLRIDDPKSTEQFFKDRLHYRNANIDLDLDVSGSHVVRVNFTEDEVGKFLKCIK